MSSRISAPAAALLCALALVACKDGKDPRKNFKDATALFARLERASPERCYLDPRMGQVEDQLKKVPPDSPDFQIAQGILKRIAANRAKLEAQKQAQDSAGGQDPAAGDTGDTGDTGEDSDAQPGSDDDLALEGLPHSGDEKKAGANTGSVATVAQEKGNPATEKAKALFERYVRLERDYDAILYELYANDATVHLTGRKSEQLSMKKFRPLMLKSLAQARKQGDHVAYTNVVYQPEGERVRISMTRASEVDGTGPASMLVGPDGSGHWVIFEQSLQLSGGKRR
jgi:hypothetical protein